MANITADFPVSISLGHLRFDVHPTQLRNVELSGRCVIERIYLGFRDEHWNTIKGDESLLALVVNADEFELKSRVDIREDELDAEFSLCIHGSAEEGLSFELSGRSRSSFRYAKVGLNIHHPRWSYVGGSWEARGPDGENAGIWPEAVVPQRVVNGTLDALIPAHEAMRAALTGGEIIDFAYSGDLFETVDQRNWADDNFKTYSTPLALGFPFDASPETSFEQKATIAFVRTPVRRPRVEAIRCSLGTPQTVVLPHLGSKLADEPIDAAQVDQLRKLGLAHVRLDLAPERSVTDQLEQGQILRSLALPTELAIRIPANYHRARDLASLRATCASIRYLRLAVARVLVEAFADGFSSFSGLVSPEAVADLGLILAENGIDAPLFVGTSQSIAEVLRDPPTAAGSGIFYGVTPQMHVDDDEGVMANVGAVGCGVRAIRALASSTSVAISPLLLASPRSPHPWGRRRADGLAHGVDPRLNEQFAGAWLAATLAEAARAEAESVTVLETHGSRGLVAAEPDPTGQRPVQQLLELLAGWRGAAVVEIENSSPRQVSVSAYRLDSEVIVLAANLTGMQRKLELYGLPPGPIIEGSLAGANVGSEAPQLHNSTGVLVQLEPYSLRWLQTGRATKGSR